MVAMNWMVSDEEALQTMTARAAEHLAELQALADEHALV
jgi:DNA-binding sugar fermentation-stimulating protein